MLSYGQVIKPNAFFLENPIFHQPFAKVPIAESKSNFFFPYQENYLVN